VEYSVARHYNNETSEEDSAVAKSKLTERQQEIVTQQKQGKTAPQIAEALGISENAVYQQLRKIRAATGGKQSAASKRAQAGRAAKSGRQSGGKAAKTGTSGNASARVTASTPPAAAPKPPTLLQLVKQELKDAEAAIKEQEQEIVAHERGITASKERIERLSAERDRKADLLAVLQGEKRAVAIPQPKPPKADEPKAAQRSRSRSSAAKGSQDKGQGQQTGESAPSGAQGGQNGAPAPAPSEPTTQAEREATAEHDGGAPAKEQVAA
jgi:DNA-binding CsgD family transcriptional regulator